MSKGRNLGAEGPGSVFQEPAVAGFVECAITSSLTSSESRIFTAAWQAVAQARQGSAEALVKLPPTDQVSRVLWESAGARSCTLDVGWMLGCLAEAITQPYDVSDDDAPLLPWDKYKNVWNLIEASSLGCQQPSQSELDIASSRLRSMQTALGSVVWDRRLFKEEAAREANSAAASSSASRWRSLKPMSGYLNEQHERQRGLKQAADALDQFRRVAAESAAASEARRLAVGGTSSMPVPIAEKRSRRMTALFRGAVPRLGEKHEQGPLTTRTAAELKNLIQTTKPSLVTRCGGVHVALWTNNQRSYVFHLTTAEGGKYLLQAPSQGELVEWIRQIETASETYKARMPLPKLGAGAAAGQRGGESLATMVREPSLTRSRFAVPLFGVPLAIIIEREASIVPIALERMFAEIEARGLREQGIYRISGAKSAIMGLKAAFEAQRVDQVELATGEFSDVHTIAGLIKQWFRDLPEPCIPFDYYHQMIAAEQIENEETRLAVIREIIWSFPKPHFNLLERVCQHLARVVQEGKFNLMAPHNIGLVFGEWPNDAEGTTNFANLVALK